ncbi:MAG: hypothetical protein RTV41_08915 [Candidatus Thorarchaeota archaeon]
MSFTTEKSRFEQYRRALRDYFEARSSFNMYWIMEVLRGCSLTEFDQILTELRPTYGQYLKWNDVSKIRGQLISNL